MACGKISPNSVMLIVETKNPIRPPVSSADKMEMPVFTPTFEMSKQHNSRFEFSRSGRIRFANFLSLSEATSEMILSLFFSMPSRPRFSPEKVPEHTNSITHMIYMYIHVYCSHARDVVQSIIVKITSASIRINISTPETQNNHHKQASNYPHTHRRFRVQFESALE